MYQIFVDKGFGIPLGVSTWWYSRGGIHVLVSTWWYPRGGINVVVSTL